MKGFKGLDLVDRLSEELWMEAHMFGSVTPLGEDGVSAELPFLGAGDSGSRSGCMSPSICPL